MTKRKLLILISLFLITFLVVIGFIIRTEAWGVFQKRFEDNEISSATIDFIPSGSFITTENYPYIYPGLDLIAEEFSLTNESTIKTNLRMQITYYKLNSNDYIYIYKDNNDDVIIIDYNENFVYDDGYFYYKTNGAEHDFLPNSGALTLITSMYYDGTKVKNDYFLKELVIKVVIEVKQSEYGATWGSLVEYYYSSGD